MDRKLATIFASDVVGFSKMMGTDEVNTLRILKERRKVIDESIDNNDGIIFGSAGEIMKEAEGVSDCDASAFITSLPYTKPEMIDLLKSCFLVQS